MTDTPPPTASDSMGFTPGRHWVEGSIYDGYAACVVGRVAVDGCADRETRTLAHVRRLPDAILYAAAPDLYEALEELHLKAVVGTDDERHAALDKAWRAISKARGEMV